MSELGGSFGEDMRFLRSRNTENATDAKTMNLHTKTYANVVVLAPVGHIDHTAADTFERALMQHIEHCIGNSGMIVLDLSAVEFMSSAGLRVLILAAKQSKKQEGTIVVSGLQPTMQEIFEISRFNIILKTFADVREALAEISSDALAAFDRD